MITQTNAGSPLKLVDLRHPSSPPTTRFPSKKSGKTINLEKGIKGLDNRIWTATTQLETIMQKEVALKTVRMSYESHKHGLIWEQKRLQAELKEDLSSQVSLKGKDSYNIQSI